MELPDFIEEECWQAFEEMRRKKGTRAPLTDFARKRILQKLTAFHCQGYSANEILAEAVERGWTSVFLWAEAPRRQTTPQEQSNVAKIHQLASRAIK